MKLLSKLKNLIAAGLITISTSCSNLPKPTDQEMDKALQTFIQKAQTQKQVSLENQEKTNQEQRRELGSFVLSCLTNHSNNYDLGFSHHEYYSFLDSKKKKPETLAEFLTPDIFSIQLNMPHYRLAPEGRTVEYWNKFVKSLGYKDKIKSFSGRNSIENLFLEIENEYFFSRTIDEEWAKRTALGLRFSYGKDAIESHLTHSFLPPIHVKIADELFGLGLDLNYYPKLNSDKLLPRLSTGIDFKYLDVNVDAIVGPFKIDQFDSNGFGIGYFIRASLETIPGKIRFLPRNSSLFGAVGYRWEKINTDPVADDTGPEFIFGIKIQSK